MQQEQNKSQENNVNKIAYRNMDNKLEDIYTAIQTIVEKYLSYINKVEVYHTNYFCKRIIILTNILKQENIRISSVLKYNLYKSINIYKNHVNNEYYLVPHLGWHRISCPLSILLENIDSMEVE